MWRQCIRNRTIVQECILIEIDVYKQVQCVVMLNNRKL